VRLAKLGGGRNWFALVAVWPTQRISGYTAASDKRARSRATNFAGHEGYWRFVKFGCLPCTGAGSATTDHVSGYRNEEALDA
jgi:hypothetical protein